MMYPPNKPTPTSLGIALILLLLTLSFIVSPAAAVTTSGTMRGADRRHAVHRPVSRAVIRRENGIVTDDDGIIGNGHYGADRDHTSHRTHHRPTASGRRASTTTVTQPTASMSGDGLDPDRSTAPRAADRHPTRRGRDLFPPSEDPFPPSENGQIGDGHAADGHVDDRADGGADGATDGSDPNGILPDVTPNGGDPNGILPDGATPMPESDVAGEADSNGARSLLPWVLVSVGVLAVLLVALALMPKKGRSR